MSLGASVGTGFVPIKPDIEGFGDELEDGVTREGSGAAERSGSKVGAVFKKAMIGVATAGIALIGKSVFDFSGFDRSMNEVFTLLPGISGDAMDTMTKQVKGFATKFAVLPTEVVPALYQSLSAGVPTDNVFSFLETATKLSKGGVTDLSTAVDGLSSVVNAYGPDVLSAQEASDLMFTTVKLGKTTVGELSASLFQVIPTAAGLGVAFGDVSAALASMTLQGVPTSVATTQLRQLFVELSKEGNATAAVFEGLAGKSFKDFIADGGNVQEALQIMEKGAADSGIAISDMFGSVEAGNAALALTGAGTDAFTNALAGMEDSAGATDAAFAQMQKGIGVMFDKFKVRFAVFLLDIGGVIAPILGKVVDWVEKHWPQIQKVFRAVFDVIKTVVVFFVEKVVPRMIGAFKATFGWLMDNKEVLIGIAAALAVGLGAMFVTWAVGAATAAAATLAAAAPFIAIGVVIAAVVAGVIYAYNHFEIFKTVVDAVGRFFRDTLWPILQSVFGWLRDNVPPIIQGIIDVFSWLWNNVLSPLVTFLTLPFALAWAAIKLAIVPVSTVIGAISTAALWLWHDVLEPLISFFSAAFSVGFAVAVAVVKTLEAPFKVVIGFIQKVIDKAISAASWIGKVFGSDITGGVASGAFTVPTGSGGAVPVQRNGAGAIAFSPQLSIIGDAPGGEAVLTRPQVQDLASWAGLTAGLGDRGFPEHVTLVIEGQPFTAIVQRHDREMASALVAGRRR